MLKELNLGNGKKVTTQWDNGTFRQFCDAIEIDFVGVLEKLSTGKFPVTETLLFIIVSMTRYDKELALDDAWELLDTSPLNFIDFSNFLFSAINEMTAEKKKILEQHQKLKMPKSKIPKKSKAGANSKKQPLKSD